MPTSSESLFPTSEHDVKHSMETVQQRWGAEQKRRRKKALIFVLPSVIIFIVAYIALAYNLNGFPGHDLLVPPPPEPEPYVPQTGIGNPDAKVIIKFYPQFAPSELIELFNQVIDAKPSEFYIDILDDSTLSPQQKEDMKAVYNYSLSINDKTIYEVKIPGKKKKRIDLRDPYIDAISPDEMRQLIIDVHTESYGKPLVPIFTLNEEYLKKLAEDEAKHKADEHGHTHDDDEEEDEKPSVKMTPVNLDNLPDVKQVPEN